MVGGLGLRTKVGLSQRNRNVRYFTFVVRPILVPACRNCWGQDDIPLDLVRRVAGKDLVGSPEEKERDTLRLLFTTPLLDREIVLGKLLGRLTHLGTVILAGLPILSLIPIWGGVVRWAGVMSSETIIENLLDDRGDVFNDLPLQGQRELPPEGTRCLWHEASHS